MNLLVSLLYECCPWLLGEMSKEKEEGKVQEERDGKGGSMAGEPMLWVIVSQRRHDPTLALGPNCCKLLSTKLSKIAG